MTPQKRRQRFVGERGSTKEGQETVGDIPALAEASQPPLPSPLSTALFPGIVLDLRALRRFFFSVAN